MDQTEFGDADAGKAALTSSIEYANIRGMTNIKKFRTAKKLSIRKLAELSGVHFVTLARIEAGTQDPRLSTLRRLAEALHVSIEKLVGDSPSQTERRRYGTHQAKRRLVRRVSRRG